MKKLLYVFIVVVFAFSCKKDDYFIQKEDHGFCGTTYNGGHVEMRKNFWFSGVITDTTTGNSTVGYMLRSRLINYNRNNYGDTLTDSTYLLYSFNYNFNDINWDSLRYVKNNQIYIENTSNVVVDSFLIPYSIWIENDTINYNYSF
ncbi:hypothetical protein N9P38_00370 [Flavobacteriales bacterium]|nr:hypothetical protein [Flavobacteriales bacterium]MDB4088738.1 hypothetical protein [Flavobacteriales bacterium]